MTEDQEIQEILYQCSISTRMTAKTFFPERFSMPFSEKVHGSIFKGCDNNANKVVRAAPRGWGKTSIIALALMARHILFRLTDFIIYINQSEKLAVMQTENLKRELLSNRMIKHFFGSVKSRKVNNDEMDEQFSKTAWVAYDTLVLPRGGGQQVRGSLFKNSRPGLIIIDDLEDKTEVTNEENRKRLKNWFYSDVLESIPQTHLNWKVIYIDTLKHEDALLQSLLTSPEWDSDRLESCDDNLVSVCEDFQSTEIINKKWNDAVAAGETDTFFQEQRNLPISSKDAAFKTEYFRYYNITTSQSDIREGKDSPILDSAVQSSKDIETVIILDPAKTVKVHSADSAIVGIGIDLANSRYFIRDIVSEKMYPDEIYTNLFDMTMRLGAKVIGVEVTSLNEFIKQPLKNEMIRRGQFYEFVWLNTRGGMKKELRVKELVPFYRMGYIYHNASCATIKKLEQQLLMFPRSALWDIMDATAYLIEMLELGERYFSPTTSEDPESEFAELDYEDPIDNWRIA